MTLDLGQVGVICPDCSPTPDGEVPVRPVVVVSGEVACWRCHRTDVRVIVAPLAALKPTITRILLDLDGVLGDWVGSVAPLFGLKREQLTGAWPPGVYDIAEVLGVSTNDLWRRVHEGGADFWRYLEPLPWCFNLLEFCASLAPTTILTSPSLDPSAAAGKTAWLQAWFGADFRDYLIGPDKPACAHPGALLIDDRDAGCEAFVKAGGNAIVFPQPWNTAHEERRSWVEANAGTEIASRPMAYMREQLGRFTFARPGR